MFLRSRLILLVALIVTVVACQAEEPQTVEVPVTVQVTRVVEVQAEVEVTRLVEEPVITEVTRVVEVMSEAEPVEAEAAEVLPVSPSMTTDVRTFSSAATGRDYVVYVTLPFSYEMSEANYPAIYITDGDFYTLSTAMAAGQVAFGQEMPEIITVGIGYGGSAMNSLQRREEDMSPEGSEAFLQFLRDELIPDIETNYRVDPATRTLLGHSLGGTFSLYTLFNGSGTFNQIIASSPSCAEGVCVDEESAFAAEHDTLPARLFVSVGELDAEVLPMVQSLDEALQASNYEGLVSQMVTLDGETHLSARPRAFISGLRSIFASESE